MPYFSIIVPVYNVEAYLRDCLDSVIAQTFGDWECLCVDDGSPDGCGRILDQYALQDARFRVFHQANAGVSAARNFALQQANGTYITFLDSDDSLLPNALASYHAQLAQSPDILRVNATQQLNVCSPVVKAFPPEGDLHGHEALDRIAFQSVLFSGYVVLNLYRRAAFNAIAFDTDMPLEEDTALGMRLWLEASTARITNICLYYYRQRENSAGFQKRTWPVIAPILKSILTAFECANTRYAHQPQLRATITQACTLKFARFCHNVHLPDQPTDFCHAFRQQLQLAQRLGALAPALLSPYQRLCLICFLRYGWTFPYRPIYSPLFLRLSALLHPRRGR